MRPARKEALWSQGQDEAVEVNQRALIDKILARYSGENTIFRELLQNADDAESQHVQIRFYTQAGVHALEQGLPPSSLPDAKKDAIVRYIIANDGHVFRKDDWQRLKKIAEGNPDEEKIGAFGVGFYSLWSVCDDPFVESGEKWMGFYWKDGKDQLLARSGDLPPALPSSVNQTSSTGNPWTTFTLNLREAQVLDGPLDLARFLVRSLIFMRHMRRIDMLVDDVNVFEVAKMVKGSDRVNQKGLKQRSAGGMMTVLHVEATGVVVIAQVSKWLQATGFNPPPISAISAPVAAVSKTGKAFTSFFSGSFFNRNSASPVPTPPATDAEPPENPTEMVAISREVFYYQADLRVSIPAAFARELERATKKAAPVRTAISLVFSREDPKEPSSTGPDDASEIFSSLCPPLDGDKSALIFIGQATSQTTGIGGHLSARFIPTVERESVDMVDRHVSRWNRELLWVGGYLARLIYEVEMQELHKLWAKTTVSDSEIRNRLIARGSRIVRFFTYKPTTPTALVGQEMEASFYTCANDNKLLPMISSVGVLPIETIRMPDADLRRFLPDLPVITSQLIDSAPRCIDRLRERRLLRDPGIDDVIKQLNVRPLTEKEMVDCLKWWESVSMNQGYTPAIRARMLDAAVLVQDNGKVIPLSLIQTYIKPQTSAIPTDMPLPLHTLSYIVTKELNAASMFNIFGWTELSLTQYVEFLVNPPMSGMPDADPETDIRLSAPFAERVLSMLGRAWQSINANQQTAIAMELKGVACIPTNEGLKKPGEAYFEKNLLFDDLPTISLPKTPAIKGGLEKMLLAIGLRRTVDLQLVFTRMIGGGSWSCQELMKYLVSVQKTLSDDEMARLKQTAAFPREQSKTERENGNSPTRLKPYQLYEPTEPIRSLGLPVLDWGEAKWRANSDEAKLLFHLGLNRHPALDVLLGLAAGPMPIRHTALQYLLTNLATQYTQFDAREWSRISFIPAVRPGGETFLAKPGEVFTNSECGVLGFAVADGLCSVPENATKLRIERDPPMSQLVPAILRDPSTDVDKARRIFEYMSDKLSGSVIEFYQTLTKTAFIPVGIDNQVKLFRPIDVYFRPKEGVDNIYDKAFVFIDFGEKAHIFLRYCGVKSEPSIKDVALLMTREPKTMYLRSGSAEKYLETLRLLAANWNNFDTRTKEAMKQSPFLLASRQVNATKARKALYVFGQSGEQEEEIEQEWTLAKASETLTIDDISLMQHFGKHILAVPEESLLEGFYLGLGAGTLSSQVRREFKTSGSVDKLSDRATTLRKHILERLTLFLAETKRKPVDFSHESFIKEGKLRLQEVQRLSAVYTLNHGKVKAMYEEQLYTHTARLDRATILLTVSKSIAPDEYDLATALCLALYKQSRLEDVTFLHSILVTPLSALKKRGFHVERILNQQKEERMRVDAEITREKHRLTSGDHAVTDTDQSTKTSDTQRSQVTSGDSKFHDEPAMDHPESRLSAFEQFFHKANEQFFKNGAAVKPGSHRARQSARGPDAGLSTGSTAIEGAATAGTSTKRPTDLDQIRRTVQTAINASRPEHSTMINESRAAVGSVSESQDDYCDTKGNTDLVLARTSASIALKLWVPKDLGDHQTFLADKIETCQRFATDILIPIGQVFRLGPDVLNIFWDNEGPLIAFNRNGTVYCNGRYFKAWHDTATRFGQKNDALISWYFSIAHELAHNLETNHNASHEFYFSSIAEEYLVRFASLLAMPKQV